MYRLSEYRIAASVESRLTSPALLIYASKVRRNIAKIIAACGSPERWRPHVKTTKCDWVWGELIDAGIRQFKCATIREAEHLCESLESRGAAGDILVAFPHVGPNLKLLEDLAGTRSTRLSVLVEDVEGGAATSLDVFLDVNPPGMDRSGACLARSGEIAAELARTRGNCFRGIHFYDGHAMTFGKTRIEREPRLFELYDRVIEEVLPPRSSSAPPLEIVTAGTPSFLSSLAHPGLSRLRHTVSPGTVVFSDLNTAEALGEDDEKLGGLEPAAVVFSRVVSRPADDIITCDAGVKTLAADSGHPMAAVCGHDDYLPLHPSEEHLPIRVLTTISSEKMPQRGSPLYLVPKHVCPTVNLAESALLVQDEDGKEGSRRRPYDSLSAVAINARAHDVRLV